MNEKEKESEAQNAALHMNERSYHIHHLTPHNLFASIVLVLGEILSRNQSIFL